MEISNGGAMWTDYVVNVYCEKLQGKWNKNMLHVLNSVCTIYTHRNSMFGDERFKRYGCFEPGMFSDLVFREACRSDSKQDIISRKEW